MPGDHDKGHSRKVGRGPSDKLHSIQIGHEEIGDNDADINLRKCFQCFPRMAEGQHGTVEIVEQELGQEIAVGLFIVDDDN